MPEVRLGVEQTAHLFEDPNETIFVDELHESICRVAINHDEAEVAIVLLLPAQARITAVQPVFGRTLLSVAEEHPEALDYELFAITPDEAAVRAGTRLFPDFRSQRQRDGSWRMSIPSLGQAVETIETWF
jgi:hypothetical protein